MAITRPTGGTATGVANTTSLSITLGTTAADDVIVVEYVHRGTAAGTLGGTSISTGGLTWTEKHSQLFATSTFSGRTLWTRATADHNGQTLTISGLTDSCAAIYAVWRGALATGDPLTAATIVGEQNTSGNELSGQITTNVPGAVVVFIVANSPDLAVTSQSAATLGALAAGNEHLNTGGTDASVASAWKESASAAATGQFSWSQTNAASGSWAYAIAPATTIDLPILVMAPIQRPVRWP